MANKKVTWSGHPGIWLQCSLCPGTNTFRPSSQLYPCLPLHISILKMHFRSAKMVRLPPCLFSLADYRDLGWGLCRTQIGSFNFIPKWLLLLFDSYRCHSFFVPVAHGFNSCLRHPMLPDVLKIEVPQPSKWLSVSHPEKKRNISFVVHTAIYFTKRNLSKCPAIDI